MIHLSYINARTKVPESWRLPGEVTSDHIIALMTGGKVKYEFEKETMYFQTKDLFFIPRGTYRAGYPCPPDYHKMYTVRFKMDANNFDLPFLSDNKFRLVQPHHYEYMKQRFSVLAETWSAKQPQYMLHCQAILLEILVLINREFELGKYTPKKLAVVREAQSFIRNHYTEPFSLNQLADHVQRSPNYICNLFKEVVGQTPTEYLQQIRISAAQDLLTHTDMPIADIAEQTGFSDPYYFSKVFKKITGLSPKLGAVE